MGYTISWSDGREDDGIETYQEACTLVTAEYEDALIGHDGDLEGGGDRTLCWADEASSINDPGVNAVAEIRREARS